MIANFIVLVAARSLSLEQGTGHIGEMHKLPDGILRWDAARRGGFAESPVRIDIQKFRLYQTTFRCSALQI